jgi:hypothetical protein
LTDVLLMLGIGERVEEEEEEAASAAKKTEKEETECPGLAVSRLPAR